MLFMKCFNIKLSYVAQPHSAEIRATQVLHSTVFFNLFRLMVWCCSSFSHVWIFLNSVTDSLR